MQQKLLDWLNAVAGWGPPINITVSLYANRLARRWYR